MNIQKMQLRNLCKKDVSKKQRIFVTLEERRAQGARKHSERGREREREREIHTLRHIVLYTLCLSIQVLRLLCPLRGFSSSPSFLFYCVTLCMGSSFSFPE